MSTEPTPEASYKFQYYRDRSIRTRSYLSSAGDFIESTGLITLNDALALWQKYYPNIAQEISDGQYSQMAIWQNCNTDDYGDILQEIDGRDDLEVKNGIIYKISRIAL